MWFFWAFALVPIAVGAFLWYRDSKRVLWQEWAGGSVVALLMAGLFQLLTGLGMTDDIETWSGYVTQSRQYSSWQEYYQEAIYRTEYYTDWETQYYTDSNGNRRSRRVSVRKSRRVFDHWEDRSRWHYAHWDVNTTIGHWKIDEEKFLELCQLFNDRHSVPGIRRTSEHNSRMIGGDPNDYITSNRTGWIEPVSDTHHFKNKVKAAPSLFSYAKVPTNISVYPWPKTQYLFRSGRVMGTAAECIDTLKWDQMNAQLGALKKVNLIIIGFGDKSMEMAGWQEASWIGGKKNDLVICYGGGSQTNSPTWVKVFGWTEQNIVKQNLQSLLFENYIDNDLIPKIAEEVKQNYVIKDWKKFDYITIEPPTWSYWVYFIVVILAQGGLWFWFHINEFEDYTLRWKRG